MIPPVDITVVGCGAVAQRLYRDALRRLERQGLIRVTSLVDPAASHAESMQIHFRGARIFGDLAAAFDAVPAQLALILTPAHLHCEHTLVALARGCHVLCEKPLAINVPDCQAMVQAARAAERVLAVGMIRRFFPAYAELRRIVQAGELGSLESIEYSEGRKFDWDVTTAASFRPRSQGGTGVLFDIGPHAVDCLAWMFGWPEVRSYSDDSLGGVESNLNMELDFAGIPALARLSWDSPLRNELRVRGDRGEAVLRLDRFDKLAIRSQSGFVPVPVTQSFAADLHPAPDDWLAPASYPQAVYCQLVQTLRAIKLSQPPAADGQSGLQTVSVLAAAISQSRPLPMPWLDPSRQEQFHQLHGAGRI